jgi:hypothetical protein
LLETVGIETGARREQAPSNISSDARLEGGQKQDIHHNKVRFELVEDVHDAVVVRKMRLRWHGYDFCHGAISPFITGKGWSNWGNTRPVLMGDPLVVK